MKKKLENTNILVDESGLREMFEGNSKSKAKEVMQMMKKIKDGGGKLIVKTPMSHFLRAIFLADSKVPIKNIQKVLSFIEIIPSFADFKSKKSCTDEMILIAKVLSKFGGGRNEKY